MPRLLKRLKEKLSNTDTKKDDGAQAYVSPNFPSVPHEPVPNPKPAPNPKPNIEPRRLKGRLWNEAYEQLKSNNAELVESYEKILSTELLRSRHDSTEPAALANRIDGAYDERWKQMQMIVETALERKKERIAAKQKIGSGLATVSTAMGQAVRAVPEAAVAWTGVCFALEIISNSIQETTANHQGILYVVSRMDWYWHLAELLSDSNAIESASHPLRVQMEKHIIDLYQKLLLYQMKSVCRYYRLHGPAIWRDAIKADNWAAQLDDIRNAEVIVQEDSRIFNALETQRRLDEIDSASKLLQSEIQGIWPKIQEHILSKEEERCLKDLRITDPRDDKSRIEDTNGGLLQGAYGWAINHDDFIAWRDEKENHLLWIKGDPGKGKTMLLCGIIDELQSLNIKPCYFFCQATDPRLNNATAILRGLIYLLVDTNRQLLSHIQEKYEQGGAELFQDANSWIVLSQIFTKLLEDPTMEGQVFMIDALDECQTDLDRLLDLIVGRSASSHAKWIVSSRNWTGIEEKLGTISQKIRFSLELNEQSVSEAVSFYITHKTTRLKEAKGLDDETELVVRDYLINHARGTFLWVALVCKELLKMSVRKRHVVKKMAEFPSDLVPLYERMMQQIRESEDSDLCERILKLVAVVYRPVTLAELASLLNVEDKFSREDLEEIVASCGSFLVVRDDVVRFVHQSAQDFLLKDRMLVSELGGQHYTVFSKSLEILSMTLRRDMYDLHHPGALIEEYTPSHDHDVLRHAQYSCVYWVDHLKAVNDLEREKCMLSLQDNGVIHRFLKEKLLNWLEALILIKRMPDAARSVGILKKLLAPLQIYNSAIIFSPTSSMVRQMYEETEGPKWINTKPEMPVGWTARLQSLEGHETKVRMLDFSPDGTQLASGSRNGIVKIWDLETGACLHTFMCQRRLRRIVFSPQGQHLATISTEMVQIWNIVTSTCLYTFEDDVSVQNLAFSSDGLWLAAICYNPGIKNAIRTWDLGTGIELKTHNLRTDAWESTCTAFAPDGTHLALEIYDEILIFDTSTGTCLSKISGYPAIDLYELHFLATPTRLMSQYGDGSFRIWDSATGEYLRLLNLGWMPADGITALSPDGLLIASGYYEIEIWDMAIDSSMKILGKPDITVEAIVFSSDGTQLATASFSSTLVRCFIEIYDPLTGACLKQFEYETDTIACMVFSPDSRRLAAAGESSIEIWDVSSGVSLRRLDFGNRRYWADAMTFSSDGYLLAASIYLEDGIEIWDITTGESLRHISNPYTLESVQGTWILRGQQRVLWLPPEYRPIRIAIYDGFVILGCRRGIILRFQFAVGALDKVLV
ncbi:uncharacterized protein TRIVIDRAFT_165017 [Trichoderma virens Gv29-8]|uniref:NACHT domain-containing protein n=1 Tax=Hypocrea virens (strain Gv29-8 / FGSC 10586) TaxID=413071 RepID=G9NCP9_HYPVG|nr:uncharacterized protein TRIVIDRAFT_165017 [Trichoderma virens Gv29-8]EHK15471.1 hypothetical protein TRIVIDRAFT_165017 [Trichoderma virens Gv29-8]UKZ51417.1 hypothetical protein TrVGV298_005177 [Trichoderma virens]